MKTCSRCGISKPLDEFDVRMSVKNGIVPKAWCKSCEKDPPPMSEKTKETRMLNQLLRRYGLSPEDVKRMGDEQDWKCPICFADISEKYYIDHDHKTGKVRELLCLSCNVGLGHFKDSVRLLARAIWYLLKHSQE